MAFYLGLALSTATLSAERLESEDPGPFADRQCTAGETIAMAICRLVGISSGEVRACLISNFSGPSGDGLHRSLRRRLELVDLWHGYNGHVNTFSHDGETLLIEGY